MSLYPLKFSPIYKEKVWGGRTLEKIGRTLPGDANTKIGESWELVDLSTTSVSGGGGGSERSVVNNGPWLHAEPIRLHFAIPHLPIQHQICIAGVSSEPRPLTFS